MVSTMCYSYCYIIIIIIIIVIIIVTIIIIAPRLGSLSVPSDDRI